MKNFLFLCVAVAGAGAAGCVHVPPGQSVEVALAKRAEVIRLPEPPPSESEYQQIAYNMPEPELPTTAGGSASVSEYYNEGAFFMQQGQTEEAIAAFEAAIQLDPQFPDAWNMLAIAYQDSGEKAKALEAFKRYKKLASR